MYSYNKFILAYIVPQGVIYDQVQAPADQRQPSDSSEVTTEACPAYNATH